MSIGAVEIVIGLAILVVVPLTTITNWSMEFQKWAPHIKFIVYKGKKKEREEMTKEIIK